MALSLRWSHEAATRPLLPSGSRLAQLAPRKASVSYDQVSAGVSAPSSYEKRTPVSVALAVLGEFRFRFGESAITRVLPTSLML